MYFFAYDQVFIHNNQYRMMFDGGRDCENQKQVNWRFDHACGVAGSDRRIGNCPYQQIGEITNAVSTLAEQSKMLALNTSIEATKAGDAGKGFSGVTAEVRDLAKSSQQSTVHV
jgi:hypothetical protein